MRPALIVEVHCVSARLRKAIFALIVLASALFSAPARGAEDLHFFKNYFVTGNYAVEGVGLYAKGVNGWATGNITMTAAKDVPAGASIVAAFLYWETVETTATPSSANGYFDLDSTGKPNAIVGAVVGSPSTPPCWSQGGTGGPGTWLRVYRADVLRYLPVDPTNDHVVVADATHTVTLPDSGINSPGSVPHTEGASLVVVYSLQSVGAAPYKAVVIYDGAFTMTKSSAAFSETIGGFYDASSTAAEMTQIVGNGQPGFAATLTVNGKGPTGVSGTPFIGAQGSRWDNLTFLINNLSPSTGASSLTTQVTTGSNQTCLSWGAVITSTNVMNSDSDGILDSWKKNGLHLNVGAPATSTTSSIPATFGGCSDYPNDSCENLPAMGAVLGEKDLFVQIDWMQGNDGHIHSPKLAALQAIASVFSPHNIYVHFDVGNRYQGLGLPYIIPYRVPPNGPVLAQGGNVILESTLECPYAALPQATCPYNGATLGYSVLGWKTGFDAIKNGFPPLSILPNFAHVRKDIFHYFLFGHALAGPFDPTTGVPSTSTPWSVSGVGDLWGGDLLVTLGLWRTDNPSPVINGSATLCVPDDSTGLVPDANLCTDQTGTSLVQAGTMFHEMGHNLGLHHGGGVDTPNCMVDYPSSMNYLYQTRGLTDAAGNEHIDFSNGTLAGLNENSLSGTVASNSLNYRLRYYGPATDLEVATGANAKANCDGTNPPTGSSPLSVRLETPGTLSQTAAIDWSNGTNIGAGIPGPGLFSEDINYSGTAGDVVQDSVEPSDKNISDPNKLWFIDHDDWDNLNLQMIGVRTNGGQLSGDVGPSDLSASDLGQPLFGQPLFGQPLFGQPLFGDVLGQPLFGQPLFGQPLFGQPLFGEVDYDTAISTLDATGASAPLVAAPSDPGPSYNQVSLSWGPPSLGQIRTYTIYRTNSQAAVPVTVIAGTVTGAPPATTFLDPVTDSSLSDIGAHCPSDKVCYDTNYQYYIVATDNSSPPNSSTPSNFATVTVDHLYVTGYTGSVIYGNPLPNSMEATISGLPAGGITATDFTCPTSAPINVGSYADTCNGPTAVVGNPPTVGVTYIDGVLMITPRPLYIDAVTNTKLYDSTTTASAMPLVEAAVPNVSGLAYTDTVIGQEVYVSPNVLGLNGSTLTVTAYTVNDGNSGKNYTVNVAKMAAGTINTAPLTAKLTANNKTYDGTNTEPNASMSCTLTGVLSADSAKVTCTPTSGTFNSSQVATAKTVTATVTISGSAAGNYTLGAAGTTMPSTSAMASASITPRPLTVTATGVNKVYDGGTTATVILTDNRIQNVGDTFTDSYASATFATRNVGNGIVVSVTGITISGTGVGNYTFNTTAKASANITPHPLTITAQPNKKIYDGTTKAKAIPTVSGLVGGDTVTGLAETYNNASIGSGKTLTVSAYTINDGNSGKNYSVTKVANTNGVITDADGDFDNDSNSDSGE